MPFNVQQKVAITEYIAMRKWFHDCPIGDMKMSRRCMDDVDECIQAYLDALIDEFKLREAFDFTFEQLDGEFEDDSWEFWNRVEKHLDTFTCLG